VCEHAQPTGGHALCQHRGGIGGSPGITVERVEAMEILMGSTVEVVEALEVLEVL
jgi:hypothetical protein